LVIIRCNYLRIIASKKFEENYTLSLFPVVIEKNSLKLLDVGVYLNVAISYNMTILKIKNGYSPL